MAVGLGLIRPGKIRDGGRLSLRSLRRGYPVLRAGYRNKPDVLAVLPRKLCLLMVK